MKFIVLVLITFSFSLQAQDLFRMKDRLGISTQNVVPCNYNNYVLRYVRGYDGYNKGFTHIDEDLSKRQSLWLLTNQNISIHQGNLVVSEISRPFYSKDSLYRAKVDSILDGKKSYCSSILTIWNYDLNLNKLDSVVIVLNYGENTLSIDHLVTRDESGYCFSGYLGKTLQKFQSHDIQKNIVHRYNFEGKLIEEQELYDAKEFKSERLDLGRKIGSAALRGMTGGLIKIKVEKRYDVSVTYKPLYHDYVAYFNDSLLVNYSLEKDFFLLNLEEPLLTTFSDTLNGKPTVFLKQQWDNTTLNRLLDVNARTKSKELGWRQNQFSPFEERIIKGPKLKRNMALNHVVFSENYCFVVCHQQKDKHPNTIFVYAIGKNGNSWAKKIRANGFQLSEAKVAFSNNTILLFGEGTPDIEQNGYLIKLTETGEVLNEKKQYLKVRSLKVR